MLNAFIKKKNWSQASTSERKKNLGLTTTTTAAIAAAKGRCKAWINGWMQLKETYEAHIYTSLLLWCQVVSISKTWHVNHTLPPPLWATLLPVIPAVRSNCKIYFVMQTPIQIKEPKMSKQKITWHTHTPHTQKHTSQNEVFGNSLVTVGRQRYRQFSNCSIQ